MGIGREFKGTWKGAVSKLDIITKSNWVFLPKRQLRNNS
jgi:hypothetical protein